ncbi:MAG TPA: DinB family protein [Dehalococcoidia bacterium]|nr:DinB family protein [Dehalococcoidia bacterium]
MNSISVLKEQIKGSHDIMEGTMAGVDPAACHHQPGGSAHPIGATYAHAVISEDFIVNMIIRGTPPLIMGEWGAKAGLSEPPPPPGGDLLAWSNRVQIDLDAIKKYAQAVYSNTDSYVDSLKAEDLDRELDVPGFGKHSVNYYLSVAAIIHPSNHCGEIAAIKGTQDLKGYPF